jgi:transposase
LPEGYIYPCEERPVRDLLRRRSFFVKQSVSNGLSIQNIVARNTGRTLNANGVRKLTDDMADDLLVQPDIALAVKCGLTVMRCAQEQIKLLENAVLKRARLQDEFKLLTSISGIGKILAMTIMLEVGTIRRFPTVGDFASYCRCVDSNHTSNNKKKGQGNSKNGNAYLGWAFVEAANFAIRYDPVIQKYYQRKNARSKHRMIALKTIAHKLARASYHILRDQTPFDAARCFGR